MNIKKLWYKRFMNELDGGGDTSGGGDFDLAAASDAIGEDLFGGEADPDPATQAAPNDREYTGKPTEPPEDKPAEPEVEKPADAAADPAAPAKPTAPRTWRAEAAAEWDKLPPTVQAEIAKREEDMFKGLEGYKAQATIGQNFHSAIEPFVPLLTQQGHNPVNLVNQMMGLHATLSLGSPEQKMSALMDIAKGAGIEFNPGDPADAPYEEPAVKALREELKAVQSKLSQTEQWQSTQARQQETEIRSKLAAEINAFAADPANSYFEEVSNDIVALMNAGLAKDLKDAYQQAIYRNPVVRDKEIARIATEKADAARKAAEDKAGKARQAMGANVRTTQKPTSGTAGLGSIDDTLKATLAKIHSRSE